MISGLIHFPGWCFSGPCNFFRYFRATFCMVGFEPFRQTLVVMGGVNIGAMKSFQHAFFFFLDMILIVYFL